MVSRTVAAVYALWFAVVLVEPAALHTCAMHGSLHAAMHGTMPVSGHTHGPHDMSSAHQHAADSSQQNERKTPCTCIGACCAAVAAVIPPLTGVVIASTRLMPAHSLPSSTSDYRPLAVEYARPPTIGPPAPTV
jgi:hypothetical protein